ncbi:MAG TPA: hypothetical protein PKH77_21750 [Anaerolineae bacterium]|nr:hypothetical protein [Anaerolineae bacterium]
MQHRQTVNQIVGICARAGKELAAQAIEAALPGYETRSRPTSTARATLTLKVVALMHAPLPKKLG